MKKLFYLLTMCLLIVSCNSEEQESVLNADSELNVPVLINKRIISQEISLEEISSYYGDEQKEIFRHLTPENRKRLWCEKFDKLLILTTNTEEKALLNRIYDEVKKIDFSENFEDDDEEIVLLNSLAAEGVSMFDWDEVYIDITFSSFEFYQAGKRDYNIYEMIAIDSGTEGGSSGNKDCTCRWDHWFTDCKKGGCIETIDGCGWLWRQPCTGRLIRW